MAGLNGNGNGWKQYIYPAIASLLAAGIIYLFSETSSNSTEIQVQRAIMDRHFAEFGHEQLRREVQELKVQVAQRE